MTVVAGLLLILSGIIVAVQMAMVSRYRADFQETAGTPIASAPQSGWPAVAVVLCVRGDESQVEPCLDRLATLDYPRFEVHVVVDHVTDPTLRRVEPWAARIGDARCFVHLLEEISPSSSLKCSGVRQCLRQLDPHVEVAVVVDADCRVYPEWLRDLVASAVEPGVGLVSGNRWYSPSPRGWGSLVRYIYNAHAIVPMHLRTMAWGGSLAIHRDVFAHASCPDVLWCSPTEDSAVHELARRAGRACMMEPRVMLLNEDPIGLAACFRFIRRQLLWTRLYHPDWPWLVGGIVGNYAVLAAQAVGFVMASMATNAVAAAMFLGGIVGTAIASLVTMLLLHGSVCRHLAERSDIRLEPLGVKDFVRLGATLPLALATITLAAVSAASVRRIEWSGVEYEVLPDKRVRLTSYRPSAGRER